MWTIPNTPDNRVLARVVNRRIRADASWIDAKSAMLRLSAVGTLLMLAGVGIGAAFFGYSFVPGREPTIKEMAAAFAEALHHTTVQTAGQVTMAPGSTVALDTKGATVGVETGNAVVALDTRNARVGLDTRGTSVALDAAGIPRPSPEQLKPNVIPDSGAPVVTNFTVFKATHFGGGDVITGWNYKSASDRSPSTQFCYYTESVDSTVSMRIDIARDGYKLPHPKPAPLDADAAAGNCVWFNGGPTQPNETSKN